MSTRRARAPVTGKSKTRWTVSPLRSAGPARWTASHRATARRRWTPSHRVNGKAQATGLAGDRPALAVAGKPRTAARPRIEAGGGDPRRRPRLQQEGLSQHVAGRHRGGARGDEADRLLLCQQQGAAAVRVLRRRRRKDPRRAFAKPATWISRLASDSTQSCVTTRRRWPRSSAGAWCAWRSRTCRRP